ncbi:MAG TPA: C-GCAxxG-C-C family protein [Treponemataceae bacterium]|nr:C-GCAxxG-C-C family protein [Treponemataceae bacterium]
MNHGQKAREFFTKGYNCAQATAAAFSDEAKIDVKTILKMMAGFGGGVAGQREMCGAVTGMVFALSVIYGEYDALDNEAKTEMYRITREAIEEFRIEFGTTSCAELLEKAGCIAKENPTERTEDYYAKRPCTLFIEFAAELAASHL